MIAFSCPHCSALLKVKDALAGKSGPCPRCNRIVQSPLNSVIDGSGFPPMSGPSTSPASGHTTLHARAVAEDTITPFPNLAPPEDYPFLAPPLDADEMGRLGPYRVLSVLGIGAMGIVFQAEDPRLKRRVALKVLKPALAASPEYHQRFLREAQLTAAIDHEHIVTIYQVGEDRGLPYLAMKLLAGESLENRLARSGGRLPLNDVLRIGREIAEGLSAAHEHKLVHRDIKPANIWLEAGRDRVKIVDFGLARGTHEDSRLTQAGAVIGTPCYMAPEQANAKTVDARCDLFSLGAVLYRASTGAFPFGNSDTLTVLANLATTTPAPPHTIDPRLSQRFSDLVMRLLAKNVEQRPPSARSVVETIAAIERGDKVETPVICFSKEPTFTRSDHDDAVRQARPSDSVGVPVDDPEKSAVGKQRPRRPGFRRKKRPRAREWGRLVLAASIVLLVIAAVVLVYALIHRSTKTSSVFHHHFAPRYGADPRIVHLHIV